MGIAPIFLQTRNGDLRTILVDQPIKSTKSESTYDAAYRQDEIIEVHRHKYHSEEDRAKKPSCDEIDQ